MSTRPHSPGGYGPGEAADIENGLDNPVSKSSAARCQNPDAIDLAEIRFQRDIKRLHDAGPRALYHALDELGARFLRRVEIEAVVRRYARLDPAVVKAVGGRDFGPRPLLLVPNDRP